MVLQALAYNQISSALGIKGFILQSVGLFDKRPWNGLKLVKVWLNNDFLFFENRSYCISEIIAEIVIVG
jgi:hypothetical protein